MVRSTARMSHSAGETQVGVEQIAVAVFLGGPAAEPSCPGRRAGSFVVATRPLSATE